MTLRLRGEFSDAAGVFSMAAAFQRATDSPVHRYTWEAKDLDLPLLKSLYFSTLPGEVRAGRATFTVELESRGGELTGQVSLVLSDLVLAMAGKTLFGLSPELSPAAVEGLNRYAAELPIVIGFSVEGRAGFPQLGWERPLLEIARQGLIMTGQREFSAAVEGLGHKLDLLGPGEEVTSPEDFARLKGQVEEAAARLIQGAAGEVVPPELPQTLEGLLRGLLPPEEEGEQ